jgi:hypothetical protein
MPMGAPLEDESDDDIPIMGGRPRPKKPGEKHDLRTSHGRFWARLDKFKARYSFLPRTRHLFWWWNHNLLSHFAIGLLPIRLSFWFHDWTSDRLNMVGEAPTEACAKGLHVWVRKAGTTVCARQGCKAKSSSSDLHAQA